MFEKINYGDPVAYMDGEPIYSYFFKDEKGNLFSPVRQEVGYDESGVIYEDRPGKLIAPSNVMNNPDFANLTNGYNWRGINNPGEKYTDPTYATNLFNLKQQNPDQYYKTLATDISDQILGNWSMNKNEHNVALTNQLESIKEKSPAAYYEAQFNLLSKQSGWQHGQNTFDKAKPYQEKMTELAPKALEAGLSPQKIDSIVGQGFSAASIQNQQRIINEQQSSGSGFNLGELLRGIAPVAALAIGGPLISSLSAPAAAAGAAGAAGAGTAGAGLSAAELLAAGGFVPTAGSAASFAAPSLLGSAALAGGATTGTGLTGGVGGATGLLGGTGAAGLSGAGSAAGIAGTQAAAGLGVASGSALPVAGMAVGALPSTVGTLSAALPAQGSVGGAGLLSAELAPGTILGSGLPGGGSIGASYALGANGLPATNLLGTPIPASSVGISNIPETVTAGLNLSPKDILDVARIGSQVLGGQPQQPAPQAAKPQSIIPRGQVDYSGILNLLQARSPQRNPYSLLG